MKFERLLVPLDTSPLAEAALAYVGLFSPSGGGSLRLVGVIDSVGEGLLTPIALAALLPERRLAYETYLAHASQRQGALGRYVDVDLREGRSAPEILAAAEAYDADLIVMASHGRGGLRRWLLGSVADTVVRTSPRPVLIVAATERRADPGERLQRLLVPLDGSALAEAALAPAAAIAARTGAAVVLACVEPAGLALHQGGWVVPDFTVDATPGIASMQYLAYVRQRLPSAAAVEIVVLKGNAAQTLTDYARASGIDLIVMTSHGRGGLGRALLGSVTDQVMRAGNPVLLIPDSTRARAMEARMAEPAVDAGGQRPA